MNETLITDLVAQQAMDQLAELDRAMELTLDKFQGCARELANGLKINVAVTGDIDKLQQITQTQMQQATQAAQQYTQQMQQQQQVIANTTNTMSRQLMEQEKLNKATREAYQQENQAMQIADRILGSREENYQKLVKLTDAMKGYRAQIKQISDMEKAGVLTTQQAVAKRAELMQAYDKTKTEAQKLTQVLAVQNKESSAAAGSYEQLSQRLERLKQAQKKLTDEQKAGESGQILEAEIQSLNAHLIDLAADMGEFQRNVGNYAIANGTLKTELSEVTGQLAELTQQYKGLSQAEQQGAAGQELMQQITELTAKSNELKEALIDSSSSLKQQLKDLTNLIAEMTMQYSRMTQEEKDSAAGREMSQKIVKLTEQAGELRDVMEDTKEAIRGSASDTRWLDTLSDAGQLVASSFGLASSSMQLFGLTEEETRQTMLKLQSSMQAVQALEKIQTALQSQSNIMRGIAIIQLKAQAVGENLVAAAKERGVVATKAATIAQKALNAVAKANPYVLLATAILAVVAALVAWTSKSKEAEKSNEKLTESIKEQSSEFAKARVELIRLQNEWDALTSKKEREEWVKRNQEAFKQLGVQIDNAKDAENLLVKNTSDFIKAMELRAQAAAMAAAAAKEFQNAIEKRSEAKERRENPTNWDRFKGIFYVGNDWDFDKSISTQAGFASGKLDAEATRSENRAKDYIKGEADYQKQFADLMKKAGFKTAGGGRTSSDTGKSAGGGRTSSDTGKSGGGGGTSSATKEELKNVDDFLNDLLDMQTEKINAIALTLIEGTEEWAKIRKKALAFEENAEKKSLEERLETLKAELEKSVKAGKITDDEKLTLMEAYKSNYEKIDESINKKYEQARKDVEESVTKKKEEEAKKRVESMQKEGDDVIALINNQSARELNELNKRYIEELQAANGNEKKIAEIKEHYAKEAERIANETAIRVLRATVDSLEQQVNIENLSDEERKRIYEELANAKIALEKAVTEAQVKEAEEQSENDAARAAKFKENMSKAAAATRKWGDFALEQFGKVADLINTIYDAQIKKIEELIDAEELRHEKEIEDIEEAAERGAITQEEAEIRKREAEQRTAEQQEKFEKRKAELSNKRAKIEKANAISKAAIDTAVAIMQTLAIYGNTPWGAPLAALVGVMGAAQIAAIVAQPIQAYAEGTKGHPHEGGLAIVGDGGRAELVMYGKHAWITPDSPTLVDLPRGAQVFPDAERAVMRPDLLTAIPRDNISGQPVIINDYHALEERMMNNTKTLAKSLNGFRESMTRELRRQRFRDYINRRT